jgi:hypothetical protein
VSNRQLTLLEKTQLGALYQKMEKSKLLLARAQLDYRDYEMGLREACECALTERILPTGEISSQLPTRTEQPEPTAEPTEPVEPKRKKKAPPW